MRDDAHAPRPASPAAVHHPLWQGRQPVEALWLPASWFDKAERARRMLAHWRSGARALRYPQGDLLVHATAQEENCNALGGWPLCRAGQALSSAPLSPGEMAGLPVADAWIVEGGQATALAFDDGAPIDLARWLAIDGLALHDTYDCRAALAEPVVLAPLEARDLRRVLNGKVPPASQEQIEFLRAMGRQEGGAPQAARPKSPTAVPRPESGRQNPPGQGWLLASAVLAGLALAAMAIGDGAGAGTPGWLMVIAALLLAMKLKGKLRWSLWEWPRILSHGTSKGESSTRRREAAAAPSTSEHPASPGRALSRRDSPLKPQTWRRWLARLAITSQVSKLLGRRQAAYMRHMLELFESGRLDEALRHAIPLGCDSNSSLGQAFGTPSPRADLSLAQSRQASITVQLGQDLDAHLRRLYRQSFEKLDREGRIDEAVFVLAELLESRQEALDYLERHQRFRQAAELALAWQMPPDVIVRLHCLAGDWRAAVAVARRDRAFANAVAQLEPRWPDAAARLREEWALALAAQGHWLQALEAIWPVKTRRALAASWLLSAEAAGGGLGAAALVKRAVLMPDTLTAFAPRLEALRDDPAGDVERAAMARALLTLKERHPQSAQLARIIAPALVADHASGQGSLPRAELTRLLKVADDRLLDADLPSSALPQRAVKPLSHQSGVLQGAPPDAGSIAILDAVPLPEGRFLVALGEAGAAIIDAYGKFLVRFTAPAEHIVIAQSRQVALVLARREAMWRVSRLDFANRRITDLGVIELDHFATEFDGIAWTVASGSKLRVLDTQRSLSEVLWQVTDLPGRVVGLSSSPEEEQIAIAGQDVELWRYRLPARRLVNRGETMSPAPSPGAVRLLNPEGGVVIFWVSAESPDGALMSYTLQGRTHSCRFPPGTAGGLPMQAHVAPPWLVLGMCSETTMHWHLIACLSGHVHASLPWPIESESHARVVDGRVAVFDRHGRIWSIDTATGAVTGASLR